MGFISTHTVEETFRRLFKEKGRASRVEVIRHQVDMVQSRSSSGELGHPDGIRGVAFEAGIAFDLFCHDRISKGLIYPECWRLQLEHGLDIDEEAWFSTDEGPIFEGKGDTAAVERVIGAEQSSPAPWHGKSPKEIAENHDWTVCLKLLASGQYFDDLDRLIDEINQWPNVESTTFIPNRCYTDDEPFLGGFDL